MESASPNGIAHNLIIAAQIGDVHAYGRLVAMNQNQVRRFLLRLCQGNSAFADDLAQDTFIKAFKKISQFKMEASFTSWLLSIAYNLFLDINKRDKRRQRLFEQHLDTSQPSDSKNYTPDLVAGFDVERALAKLKITERTAVILCLQEGLSHSAAAEIMAVPLGTVKSYINRGKATLKLELIHWQNAYGKGDL